MSPNVKRIVLPAILILIHGCLLAADRYTTHYKRAELGDGNAYERSIWHSISGMYMMFVLLYFGTLAAGPAHQDGTPTTPKDDSNPKSERKRKPKNQHLTNLVNGLSALIADPKVNTADTLAVFKEMTKLLEVVVDVEKGKVKLSAEEYQQKFAGILANLKLLNARIDDECEARADVS